MKKFYILVVAVLISTGVSAQKIVDLAFANQMPFGVYTIGNEAGITFTAENMEMKFNAAQVGIQAYFTGVTEYIEFDLDFVAPDRWTYFLLINIKNGTGDTIAQVLPQCVAGGKILLSTKPKSGSALLTEDFVEVSGITRKDSVSLAIKIDVTNKMVYASRGEEISYTNERSTPLFSDPDGKIIFEFIVKQIAGSDKMWMRKITVNGTGTMAERWEASDPTGINFTDISDDFVKIPSAYSLSSGIGLAPVISENVANYEYSIYDIRGRKIFSSNSRHASFNGFPSRGLYIMSVRGNTLKGELFNKSGKILVVN
jgi:hypothetical protein